MHDKRDPVPCEANRAEMDFVYADHWRRATAAIIDSTITIIVLTPLMLAVLGGDHEISKDIGLLEAATMFLKYIVPIIVTIFFWTVFKATPGKMLMDCEIVHMETGEKLGVSHSVKRYVGYFVAHDKMADSVVIRKRS